MSEVEELAALVDGLRRDRRRGPYAGHGEYLDAAWAVHEAAERLLDGGLADQAAPKLRTAVDRVAKALMYLDDSGGTVGDALRALTVLYAKAVCAAPPRHPQTLATWIDKTTFDGPGWPDLQLANFAAGLGPVGLAHLADLVEDRASGLTDEDRYRAALHIQDLREQLAANVGDTDGYIGVVARDLGTPGQYLKITEALRDAARTEEATVWARRGLAAHPTSPYLPPLRDALVDLLTRAGNEEEALAVRRAAFERTPVHAVFHPLQATATRIGSPQTIQWALGLLRERLPANPAGARELILCLQETGQHDDAWQVAVDHLDDLGKYLLQDLIEQRRTTHPADVTGPYRRLIAGYLAETGNKYRYQYAVRHLKALRALHQQLGTPGEFADYLHALRAEHKRKTSFLAQLDKAGLGG